jgi:hypothetical protein
MLIAEVPSWASCRVCGGADGGLRGTGDGFGGGCFFAGVAAVTGL